MPHERFGDPLPDPVYLVRYYLSGDRTRTGVLPIRPFMALMLSCWSVDCGAATGASFRRR